MGGSRRGEDDGEQELFEDAVDTTILEVPGGGGLHDEIREIFRSLAANAKSWSLAEELKRNDEITTTLVEDLSSWCRGNEILPNATDPLLIAFLHCCRGDLEAVKPVVTVYDSIRTKTPEVFADRSYHSEEVQRAKSIGYFCLLPKKTPDGFRVIVQALRNPDPSVFVYSSSSKAQFLTMDAAVRAEPTAAGYVFIFDMEGVQMSHMWAWGFRLPRKIFKYLQEGLPLRMQCIHFVNTTPLMDRVMRMLRPFIRNELNSMFHFHKANAMEDLYAFIPRECLPQNYGGFLPSLEILQDFTDVFLNEVDNLVA